MKPIFEIAIISFFVALFSKAMHMLMVDYNREKELKEKSAELRKKMKEAKMGSKEYLKLSEKSTELSLELSRMQLKPSIVTMIPLVLVIMWMRKRYAGLAAFVILPISLPLIGNDIGWLLTYFLITTASNIMLKQVEKIWRKRK